MSNTKERTVILQKAGTDLVDSWARLLAEIYGEGEHPWIETEDVLVKVNAVNFEPHVFVDPGAIGALVTYLRRTGARRVTVMESCTNGSFTRLVFDVTGIGRAVSAAGGRSVYLDEGPLDTVSLAPGKEVRVARFLAETLVDNRSKVFYVNLAKLKTHSMTGVTFCLKNQWGFITPGDRSALHDSDLHRNIALVHERFRPDLNLMEGLMATNHGHFPLKGFDDDCLWEAGVLLGGLDTVAVDAAACRFLGIDPEGIDHLRLAAGDADARLDPPVRTPVPVDGPPEPFSPDLVPFSPEGITLHAGTERCCPEGCYSNPVCSTQVVAANYGGRGKFHIFVGKGHDMEAVDACPGPALVVGPCAEAEVHDRLVRRLGKGRVRLSPGHNNLKTTITHIMALMNVSVLEASPIPVHRLMRLYLRHRLALSKAEIGLL